MCDGSALEFKGHLLRLRPYLAFVLAQHCGFDMCALLSLKMGGHAEIHLHLSIATLHCSFTSPVIYKVLYQIRVISLKTFRDSCCLLVGFFSISFCHSVPGKLKAPGQLAFKGTERIQSWEGESRGVCAQSSLFSLKDTVQGSW